MRAWLQTLRGFPKIAWNPEHSESRTQSPDTQARRRRKVIASWRISAVPGRGRDSANDLWKQVGDQATALDSPTPTLRMPSRMRTWIITAMVALTAPLCAFAQDTPSSEL